MYPWQNPSILSLSPSWRLARLNGRCISKNGIFTLYLHHLMISYWELNMWHKTLGQLELLIKPGSLLRTIPYCSPFYKLCTGCPAKVIPFFFEISLHPFKWSQWKFDSNPSSALQKHFWIINLIFVFLWLATYVFLFHK